MTTPDDAAAGVRHSALIAATQHFIESLKALGVESVVIGYALTEDPQGQGVTKIVGNNTLILNLIASIIKGMRPVDFKNLLTVMLKGEYFSSHRGEPEKPIDKIVVN